MSVLQNEFDSYELWGLCESVQSQIEKILKTVNASDFPALVRLSEAVVQVASLRHIPAWRFPDAGIPQALHSYLTSVMSPLSALVENPDVSIEPQIEDHLVQISTNLLNSPSPIMSPQHLADMTALTEKFKVAIGQAIERAQQASVKAEAELQNVVTAKDAAIATLTEQIEDLRETIAGEKADVSAQATRLDTALTTNNTAFTTKMTEWQESLATDRKEAKETAEQQLLASQKEASQHVSNLEALEEQSRKLTEATARNSISTEYGTHAQLLTKSANRWSFSAVALAVGGLVVLVFMINGIEKITPAEAIWKTSVSALTIAIATYMGREAAGHRRDARDAKRMQLDLNALEPFLANMKDDTAHDLREQFARQIFSRPMANSKDHAGFAWLGKGSAGETGSKDKEAAAE